MLDNNRILVTGATGFTGKYLLQALSNSGNSVIGTSLNHAEGFLQVNLNSLKDVEDVIERIQPTSVVHLAGVSFAGETNLADLYASNLLGTRNLLASIARLAPQIKSVIVASSASIYGPTASGLISENEAPRPRSDYGISKASVEILCRSWMDVLPITITRPFNYTGRGQNNKFVIPKIINAYKSPGETLFLGNIDVKRDFSDVRDVVNCYEGLLRKPKPGETFNLASGKATSISEVIGLVYELSGKHVRIETDPALLRKGEIEMQAGDSSKIKDWLGFSSCRSLRDTLLWMLDG